MDYKTEAQPKATAGGVPVFCAHDAIVAIEKLIPNPKNPNTHPDAQIQALGRIIRQTGWRAPITVSKRSGFIVKGHGRLAAAKLEGLTEVPVDYQNYTNEAEEYADLVADNRIAELAEIDNKLLADIFADIDTGEIPMELTGYTDKEWKALSLDWPKPCTMTSQNRTRSRRSRRKIRQSRSEATSGSSEITVLCAEIAQTKLIALSYSTRPSLRSFSWIHRTAPEVFRNPDAAPEVSEPNATTQTGKKSK